MASTNFTTHYSIPLPLGTDLTTPMDYNEAAEDIDTALFGAVTDAGNASEAANEAVNTANTASAAVDEIGADLALEKAKIVQLQTRITAAENDIDDVYTDVTDMITAYKEPSATSTHAYAIGDYFIYNETLYKATAAISIGDTIVPNTNCETTNVSSELKNTIVLLTIPGTTTWADACVAIHTAVRNSNVDFSKLRLRFYSANGDNYMLFEPLQYVFTNGGTISFTGYTYIGGNIEIKTIRTHANVVSESDGLSFWTSPAMTANHYAVTDTIVGKIELIAL